ncbi:MAG: S26 family signal peptidase [Candidatus Thiodubiliella endoseptemdiera]|uniref:S26 family signal peptidase n=1 Tax=Candidatus Thiodubiliella endoseptemdiera TaxID=2738886 RepID=A0A853F363_9GAMM|nr:S26 family signal peptidase [Candidatus Thiodubiliella endoseptemdiera]
MKRNKKTGSGKTIKQFYYDDIVPQNKAILWGSNIESFDSRYWGFIDYNKLNKMKLIW